MDDFILNLWELTGKVEEGNWGHLLNDAEFSATVESPGGFVAAWVGWHFFAEADGLDACRGEACGDEGFADG